jgi:hypothetical protein
MRTATRCLTTASTFRQQWRKGPERAHKSRLRGSPPPNRSHPQRSRVRGRGTSAAILRMIGALPTTAASVRYDLTIANEG